MIFDVHPLTIRDFLVIKSLILRTARWGIIVQQSKKYGWYQALLYYLSIIKALYERLYHKKLELPIKAADVKVKPKFPFWYPSGMRFKLFSLKMLHDRNMKILLRARLLGYLFARYAYERFCFDLFKTFLMKTESYQL